MATTKEKVKEKVLELYNDYRPRLEESLDCVLRFGKIDFENEPDNWQLPKELIQALASDMIRCHRNVLASRSDKRRIKKFEETIIVGHLLNLNSTEV